MKESQEGPSQLRHHGSLSWEAWAAWGRKRRVTAVSQACTGLGWEPGCVSVRFAA